MNSKNIKIGDTVTVALLPLLGYLIAFGYEAGYVSYYNLDISFIKLGLEQIIFASLGLIAGLSVIYVFFEFFFIFVATYLKFPFARTSIGKAILVWLCMSFFTSTLLVTFGPFNIIDRYIISIIFTILLAFDNLVIPILFSSNKSIEARFSEEEKSRNAAPNLINYIWKRPVVKNMYAMILACGMLVVLSVLTGLNSARNNDTYYLFKDNDHAYVLIRNYGNTMIYSQLDIENKTFLDNIRITLLNDSVTLKRVKLGRLPRDSTDKMEKSFLLNLAKEKYSNIVQNILDSFSNSSSKN